MWKEPGIKFHQQKLKSEIADIKNVGGRKAGIITAALFLKYFLKGEIPWAHIDIGGTAYYSKKRDYFTSNATGYGVRLLVEFLESL